MREMLVRIALAVGVGLATPALASPPAAGSLGGVVTHHELATPLPNVEITLRSYEAAPLWHGRTDTHGVFRIVELPPGLYRLEATRPGFEAFVVDPVVVPAHLPRQEHIALQPTKPTPRPTT